MKKVIVFDTAIGTSNLGDIVILESLENQLDFLLENCFVVRYATHLKNFNFLTYLRLRAKRRYDELIARGVECDYNTILSDIEHRDYEDENRELAPLKQASDAIVIDTSDMTIEEASDKITELFKNKKEEYERNHKG